MIIGIDEVGRGAWAGPVAVAAVAIEPDVVAGLADSKLLKPKRRSELALCIRAHARDIGIGWVSAQRIDSNGMTAALRMAAEAALAMCVVHDDDSIIVDGTVQLVNHPRSSTLKAADKLIQSVSAASIIAKVARDSYMQQMHGLFPEYGFGRHVGYGTAAHQIALDEYGVSPIHRMSFRPMATDHASDAVTGRSKNSGHLAEQAAAEHLQHLGHTILEQNWKTRFCEIDIISRHDGTIYFHEVKYRSTRNQGGGLDYITVKKRRQMTFAAELWRARHDSSSPARLSAIAIHGASYALEHIEYL